MAALPMTTKKSFSPLSWLSFGLLCGFFGLWLSAIPLSRAQTKDKDALVLWHSYRAEEKRALEVVIERFHQKQKTLRVRLLAIPYDAYPDKISAATPRGHGPDLFIFAHDRIGDWADKKILEPITFWVDEDLLKTFFPQTVAALAYNNALYGLPLAYKSLALFTNTALVPTPPTTTDDLIALAKKLTDPAKERFGLAYETTNFYQHAVWLHGFGGGIFEGDTLIASNDAAIQALDFAYSLQKTHKLLPAEPTSQLISSLFNRGQAAMVINGPWFRGEIDSKIKYTVSPMPLLSATKKPAAPFLTSEAILLSRYSKKKKEAFEVMRYLTSAEAAMIRMTLGKQPVATLSCYQTPEALKDPILLAFRKQLDTTVLMDNRPQMRVVWAPMVNALGRVFRGQQSSKDALLEAQKEIRSYLQTQPAER